MARGRPPKFRDTDKIRLLVQRNPHRKGGRFERWQNYREGMSVREAKEAGFNCENLRWSVRDKHIEIVRQSTMGDQS
jgi:hypothetical protein